MNNGGVVNMAKGREAPFSRGDYGYHVCPCGRYGQESQGLCACGRPWGGDVSDVVRPDWHEYFLGVAFAVAQRADCTRRKAGAVIVDSRNRIVSTGYNGAPAGQPGCLTAGTCPRGRSDVEPGSSYDTGPGACIAVHAEANALIHGDASRYAGGALYVVSLTAEGHLHPSQEPCGGCARLIAASGVRNVYTMVNRGDSLTVRAVAPLLSLTR